MKRCLRWAIYGWAGISAVGFALLLMVPEDLLLQLLGRFRMASEIEVSADRLLVLDMEDGAGTALGKGVAMYYRHHDMKAEKATVVVSLDQSDPLELRFFPADKGQQPVVVHFRNLPWELKQGTIGLRRGYPEVASN